MSGFSNKKTASKAGAKSSRAGTPNKSNKELRDKIKLFLEDNYDDLLKDLKEVDPSKRLDFYIKLLEYGVPKLSRVEQTNTINVDDLDDEQIDRLFESIKRVSNG